jgi:adenosine kinase
MDIILTGSVAFDYLMRFPGYFRDHILPDKLHQISLSFLVESMVVRRGGIAPNIAYTLALLGGHPRLMATVGEDFAEYRAWLENQGVDTHLAQVIKGVFTASFFVNTDRSNAQIASFYPGAMAYAAQLSFKALDLQGPALAVISPNDPGAMNQYVDECIALKIPYLYDPSQQIVRLDAENLRRGVEGARALFVNDYEFGLIQKATGLTPEEILAHTEFFVVTRGEEGASIYTASGEIHVPIFPAEQIVDPTGVGDAFRGGFLAGYSRGWDLKLCGEMGSLAATYCLENEGTQAHYFTPSEFALRFRKRFDDAGRLDTLADRK